MSGMDLGSVKSLLENYYKQNEKKDTQSSGGKYFVKKSELPGQFRIVPYKHAKHPFIEIWQHWDIAGEKNIVCPRQFGNQCPICDLAEKFKADASWKLPNGQDRPADERQQNWKIFTQLQASARYFSPVLSRSNPELGVRLIGYPETIYLAFIQAANDPDCGDFVDPVTGRDITFSLIDLGKGRSKLAATMKMNVSRLAPTDEEIEKIKDSTPNFLEADPPAWQIKSAAEIVQILSRFGDGGTKEDEITISTRDESTGGGGTNEPNKTDIALQLDQFLKG